MLQLITGRSGSGKTEELYKAMYDILSSDADARVFLLVPEQSSFENERHLLRRFGATISQRVQVLSFTRMADTVFREIGGVAGTRMDSTVSLLLMSQALTSVSDHLQIYQRHSAGTEYLQALMAMLSECKQCCVSPRALAEAVAAFPQNQLRKKAEELSLIFEAYSALVAQTDLIDPLDDLTVLANRLPESHLFNGAFIFVDDFKGFTGQELAILEHLISCAAQVTVSLCTDSTSCQADPAANRFFTSIRTGQRLRDMAHSHSVPVAAIRHLDNNYRTEKPALLVLEREAFTSLSSPYEEPTDDVEIVACTDRSEECRYAARTIRRLLRQEGGHCRDFTIVVRDMSTYAGMLKTALEQEGLPCYADIREPILTQPLITVVESALSVISHGWEIGDLLRLCKTGLLGFSTASLAKLENYSFTWKLRGRQWKDPFYQHPDGLGATLDAVSDKQLYHLNLLRRRLTDPLIKLQNRLSEPCNGKEFATALWQFLNDLRLPRMVRFQAARLYNNGETALFDYQNRMWEYLVGLLDTFALSLPMSLPLSRLAELFHLAVSSADLGVIPQSLDSVVVGQADRIRYTKPSTVIILGANEGVFPAYPVSGGVLTDRERRQLIQAGLPIADDLDHQTAEERYYAYMALAAPSRRLLITYARKAEGEALLPSSLVETVRLILPHCHQLHSSDPAVSQPESTADAFAFMARAWHDNTVTGTTYRHFFSELPSHFSRMAAIRRFSGDFSFDDADNAKRLFGTQLRLSPSQVETYHRCRFAYFCQYGIRIRPRKSAELNAAEAGTLVHHIMQILLPMYAAETWEGCTRERIEADTATTIDAYVETYMGGAEDKDSRFRNLIRQLTRLCSGLLWRVVQELRESRFVPVDYELPIGRFDENGNGIPPWILTTPDGTTIQVQGTVDRVDILHHEGQSYIRIVDYKTGNKQFDLSEVLEGINLQMLIYLFSICQKGQARYGQATPAGVLYLPAKLPVIRVDRSLSPEQMEKERLATMRMNGLLIDDPEILRAMEVDLGGIFIPASLTSKGALSKTSSLASLEQFGRIQHRIQQLLTTMASTLHQGDIAALPIDGTIDYCRYCQYHDICGHEKEDPVRAITQYDLHEALRQLDASDSEEVVYHGRT